MDLKLIMYICSQLLQYNLGQTSCFDDAVTKRLIVEDFIARSQRNKTRRQTIKKVPKIYSEVETKFGYIIIIHSYS